MTAAFATIAALLSNTPRQIRHRHLRLVLTLYLVYAVVYALSLALIAFMLLQAWRGQDWMEFWRAGLGALPIGFGWVTIREWGDSNAYLSARITLMHEAAQTGDETLAPLALQRDGERLVSESPLGESTSIGPYHRPSALHFAPFILATSVWVITLVLLVPGLLASGNRVFGIILAMALLLCGSALGLLAYRTLIPLHATVDADGLRWPAVIGRPHRLRWSEAQSLIRVTDERQITDDRRTVYAVIGETAAFAWTITGRSSETAAGIASRQIIHTIAQHTGLPLRDLSGEARRLAHRRHTGISPQRRIRVLAIGSVPILLLMLAAGVLQVIQPQYFEYLYAHSHTSTPLYADPLTHPDHDWPETDSARFADNTYTITSDLDSNGYYPSVISSPRHYDNALYEATARTHYSPMNSEGAGIAILGNDPSQPALAFYVSPTGRWELKRKASLGWGLDDKVINDEDSATIQRGFGAPNRIAVLAQNGTFTFYINGHYIIRYHDTRFAGGYVGLYLEPAVRQGSFTDFAIYPA